MKKKCQKNRPDYPTDALIRSKRYSGTKYLIRLTRWRFVVIFFQGMGQSNYTLPVSVPVNTYGESLLGSSPQMAHTSISPRPSSSETDSGINRKEFDCRINDRIIEALDIKSILCDLLKQFTHLEECWKWATDIPHQHRHWVDHRVPDRPLPSV